MKYIFTAGFLLFVLVTKGQDIGYVKSVLDTLSAPGMHGRGYVNNGDKIASGFIAAEFQKAGLKSFGKNYYQDFTMPINTFPDSIGVKYGGAMLSAGTEYTIASNSPAAKGRFVLVQIMNDSNADVLGELKKNSTDLSGKVVITDFGKQELKQLEALHAAGYIFVTDKIGWHVSQAFEVKDYFTIDLHRDRYADTINQIEVDFRNYFISQYQTRNVIGYIKGSKHPDKYFVISAHYDHLGRMGAGTYFPGANDNASGTAMLLDLANYFSRPENKPEISMVFMAFSAEEAGLLGSINYVMNPLFSLDKIEFLINLDMVGSGSEGIKVVNGAVFEKEFKKLQRINDKNGYLSNVGKRGEAANSDHYPFYYKGVPSFFIYTLGPECSAYHNVFDTAENVPFTEYTDLFLLVTGFVKTY